MVAVECGALWVGGKAQDAVVLLWGPGDPKAPKPRCHCGLGGVFRDYVAGVIRSQRSLKAMLSKNTVTLMI